MKRLPKFKQVNKILKSQSNKQLRRMDPLMLNRESQPKKKRKNNFELIDSFQ